MRSFILSLTLIAAPPLHATDLCAPILRLMQSADSDFQSAETLPEAESCRTSFSVNGITTYHCAWRYDFRDTSAVKAFEDMNETLGACLGTVGQPEDDGVNHPDTYQQLRHETGEALWRVSLKDKSALGATYVFVSVEAR